MSEIYLDCHATTPLDPRVFEQMQPWMVGTPANAHAQQHNFGQRAEDAVAVARSQVARLIGARAHEVVFTSGATEANNLALLGVCSSRPKVLVSAIEHPSVGACVQALEQAGKQVEQIPVNRDGVIDVDALKAKVDDTTALVSIMLANHEVGTVQPIRQIADIVRQSGARLHTDATQAAGKLPIDVSTLDVDLLSFSAHKLYGPMGIGALFVRADPSIVLQPRALGGSQEFGLRAGTTPTFLAVGFGAACKVALDELERDIRHCSNLRDELLLRLKDNVEDVHVNGTMTSRLPGNLNITIEHVNAETLMNDVPHIALSSGAACASGSHTPSPVLAAMGRDAQHIDWSIRIGIGRFTRFEEIVSAAAAIATSVKGIRRAQSDSFGPHRRTNKDL